jgi:hypothetical protein
MIWILKVWKYLFALPPKQELAAVRPPICGHCGSADVEVIGTLPVRKILCRACGKGTEGTELTIVPVKDNYVWRFPSREKRTFRGLSQFALNNERSGPGLLGRNDDADRIADMTNKNTFGRFG